jgi:hypothetical protein
VALTALVAFITAPGAPAVLCRPAPPCTVDSVLDFVLDFGLDFVLDVALDVVLDFVLDFVGYCALCFDRYALYVRVVSHGVAQDTLYASILGVSERQARLFARVGRRWPPKSHLRPVPRAWTSSRPRLSESVAAGGYNTQPGYGLFIVYCLLVTGYSEGCLPTCWGAG